MPDDKISGAAISARALELKAILQEHGWKFDSLDSYALVTAAVANVAASAQPDRDAYVHMVGELRRCLNTGANMLFAECFTLTPEEQALLDVGTTSFTRH